MRGFPVSPYVTILSPAHPKVNPGEEPLTPNVFLGVVPCSILPRSQVAESRDTPPPFSRTAFASKCNYFVARAYNKIKLLYILPTYN